MKTTVSDLAAFGGEPACPSPLHVGRPNLGDRARLMEMIGTILDSAWLTNNGPYVRELEERIAATLQVRHAVAMCNGTVALEIAVRALEMEGEVIVPSFTFVATAHCLQWQGITPVFCDIDPATHNIDPRVLRQHITPRTTGIIGVHLWGRPCPVEALADVASRRGLRLLFDASHAFACSHRGRMIGNFGDAEVFSFHATKFVNTFEGGAVVTNSDDLAERMRLMRNFGFKGYDNVIYLGTNGKMSEVCAAMGLACLDSIEQIIDVNHRNYELYAELLRGVPGLQVLPYNRRDKCNYQYVVLQVDDAALGLSRDGLIEILHAENILARRYFFPGCHRMEPYRSHYPYAQMLLPETENCARKVVVLPTGAAVGISDVETVCHLITFVARNASQIQGRLLTSPRAEPST